MDNLNNNSSSYENSLCSVELKSSSISQHHTELQQPQQLHHTNQLHQQQQQQQQPKLISPHRQRAMSFLYCISKRLGRRVQHELVYNSQDDLRSSSTDSFSLSLDRGSSSEKHIRSSSIDLSSDGHSSRASSSSASSRLSSNAGDENEALVEDQEHRSHHHGYETRCYHVADDDDDDAQDELTTKCTVTVTNSTGRTPLKGLNLNRISISSVSRVLQHISSSSSSSTSMRSLSCNSTPLKRTSISESKKSALSTEKKTAEKSKSSKPQQQRILRQPTSYVYLKGMSGLPTRRVPRSSVCCSYACR